MLKITANLFLDDAEIRISFVRAPGPGGQNVNKVATAVQLRFNVLHSKSLPDNVRRRLIALMGNQLSSHGDLVIKASRFRSQARNRQDSLDRLQKILRKATFVPKTRKKTKPSAAVTQRRLAQKKLHAKKKSLRQRKIDERFSP